MSSLEKKMAIAGGADRTAERAAPEELLNAIAQKRSLQPSATARYVAAQKEALCRGELYALVEVRRRGVTSVAAMAQSGLVR